MKVSLVYVCITVLIMSGNVSLVYSELIMNGKHALWCTHYNMKSEDGSVKGHLIAFKQNLQVQRIWGLGVKNKIRKKTVLVSPNKSKHLYIKLLV